jgi:GWxTD domain-containing protein
MRMTRIAAAATLFALVLAGSASARGQARARPEARPPVAVDYVRYWRGPTTTLVEGLVRVSFRALAGGQGSAAVDFAVKDEAGRTLHSESWNVGVGADVIASGAAGEVTTPFTVGLAPGKYTVSVVLHHGPVTDSTVVPVEAYAGAPLLSDLVVSPNIRVEPDSVALGPSEMRRGRYVVERAPLVQLTETAPVLDYYLELYAHGAAAPDDVSVEVRSRDGSRTLLHAVQAAQVTGAGLPLTGRLNLAGLPPGDYELVVGLQGATERPQRSASFTMLPLDAAPRMVSAPPAPAASARPAEPTLGAAAMDRYFNALVMPDTMVAQLIDALLIAPPGPALPRGSASLPRDAQRKLLAEYFGSMDRPGSSGEALLEEFTGRVKEANRLYSERTAHRPGVHTDRGRIYLKYGAPDEKTSLEMQNRRNIELWKYTRQRSLRFVFLDDNGFGNLRLIMTTDPYETTVPDWQERIGDDNVVRMVLQ